MLTFAKVLIMLVRFGAIAAIVLGILLLNGNSEFLRIHIGLGFLMTALIVLLAILALVRGAVGLGIVGIAFAFLLPFVGLKQFPLRFGANLGWIQITHIVVALIALGIAEAMNGAIRKSEKSA